MGRGGREGEEQLWKCPERPRDLRCGSDLVCLSVCPTKNYKEIQNIEDKYKEKQNIEEEYKEMHLTSKSTCEG